jgi:phenylacetate-CoA ligase
MIERLSLIGNPEAAHAVAKQFHEESPAYRKLLGESLPAFRELPILTKQNFYAEYSWKEIVPERNRADIFQIVRSSGPSRADSRTTGSFWPKLKSIAKATGPLFDKMLAEGFRLREKRTLVIVGLSLGSWAGGNDFIAAFRGMATMGGMPLVLFSPGSQHEEILEALEEFGPEFEQILLLVNPSVIYYLERLAGKRGRVIPWGKVYFLATGEPFPESLRLDLCGRHRRTIPGQPLMSVYAASDTGILGIESAPLVRFRQHLAKNSGLAERLGLSSPECANLFHANVSDGALEEVDGELVVTRWQGLPLVRYNLRDEVRLLGWTSICTFMAAEDPQGPWNDPAVRAYPDVIEIKGRAEGGALAGSNVSEGVLRRALLASSLARVTTQSFVAWMSFVGGRQSLELQLELAPGASAPGEAALEDHYRDLVEKIGELQPEFRDDYRSFFSGYETEGHRVIGLRFSPFPHLSEHPRFLSATKRKVFLEQGPI